MGVLKEMSTEKDIQTQKKTRKKRKTVEERMEEKNLELQGLKEKMDRVKMEQKQLEKEKAQNDNKKRTHRLISIGAIAEQKLGRAFTEEDLLRFSDFLDLQERNGRYYTKAMEKIITISVDKS